MDSSRFRFRHVWRLGAPVAEVAEALGDLAAYPTWWPQVRSVARIDDASASVAVRSVLPVTLRLVLTRDEAPAPDGVLRARIAGDLDGYAQWEVVRSGRVTEASLVQEVRVGGPALKVLAVVARPVLTANHRAMMRAGEWGLSALLGAPVAR